MILPVLPIWLLMLFLLLCLVLGVAGLSRASFRRTLDHPACARCHYNLTASLSALCPECGTTLYAKTVLPPGSRIKLPLRLQLAGWTLYIGLIGWTVGYTAARLHVLDPIVPTATTEISRHSLLTQSQGNLNLRITAAGLGSSLTPRKLEIGAGPPGGVPANALTLWLPETRFELNGKKVPLTEGSFRSWAETESLPLTPDELTPIWTLIQSARSRTTLDPFLRHHSANSQSMGGALLYYTGGSTVSTYALSPQRFTVLIFFTLWLAGAGGLWFEAIRTTRLAR